jgi:hypothetical protein
MGLLDASCAATSEALSDRLDGELRAACAACAWAATSLAARAAA